MSVTLCALALCCYGLALTYSRGGLLAALCGLTALALWGRGSRRIALISGGIAIGTALLLKGGMERVVSSTRIISDASITNRFALWKDTLCLISDYWLTGVGPENFLQVYQADYQSLEIGEHYTTAVNDYLTIGAHYGLFALLGYLFGWIFFGVLLFQLRQNERTGWIASISLAGGIVYVVASFFSTFFRSPEVVIPFLCFLLISGGAAVFGAQASVRRPFVAALQKSAGVVAVLGPLLFAIGHFLGMGHPDFRRDAIKTPEETFELRSYFPPGESSEVSMLILANPENAHLIQKYIGRGVAERGFRTTTFVPSSLGFEGVNSLSRLYTALKPEGPVVLAAYGDVVRILAGFLIQDPADEVIGVVYSGAQADWPFPELSPLESLKALDVPLLLLHHEDAVRPRVSEAHRLMRAAKALGVDCTLGLIPDSSDLSDRNWLAERDLIVDFLQSKIVGPKSTQSEAL